MPPKTDSLGAPTIALLGMAALASAMGVGRFAFTPLMPLMQAQGILSFGQGAWLASANYGGYLVGALACSLAPPDPDRAGRAARTAILAVAAFTGAMGMTLHTDLWLFLRFAAGVASAYALVGVSAWALPALSRLGHAGSSGRVFAGVGIGITVVGAISLAAGITRIQPGALWLGLGVGSAIVAALAWSPMGRPTTPAAAFDAPLASPVQRFAAREWRLILCYGLFGFGYIVPATFLPAMARERVDDPAIFGAAWPLLGAVAALSTLLAARALRHLSPRRIWIMALPILSVGVLAPLLSKHVVCLLLAALCTGGTFMVITMAGMLEARQHSGNAARLMAAMTAAFAAGQLLGPLLVGLAAAQGLEAITLASGLAAAGLLFSTWVLQQEAPAFPHHTTQEAPP